MITLLVAQHVCASASSVFPCPFPPRVPAVPQANGLQAIRRRVQKERGEDGAVRVEKKGGVDGEKAIPHVESGGREETKELGRKESGSRAPEKEKKAAAAERYKKNVRLSRRVSLLSLALHPLGLTCPSTGAS